jgi:Tol biopolymer transport system component
MIKITIKTILLAALSVALIISCSKNSTDNGGQSGLTSLTGPYLGNEPPGLDPVLFAPAAIAASRSWFYHGPIVFSPDGQELHFSKYTSSKISIFNMHLSDGYWTVPEEVTFAGSSHSNCPFYSVTGDTLFFIRDVNGLKFYQSVKVNGEWTESTHINIPDGEAAGIGWQFSIARNRNLYFESFHGDADDLFVSRFENGRYVQAEALDSPINTSYSEIGACIASDEQYLIFASNRPGGYGYHDLYISFPDESGGWTEPLNMGSRINSNSEDAMAVISPDGNYLFYLTRRAGDADLSPYWVNADFIDSLRAGVVLN